MIYHQTSEHTVNPMTHLTDMGSTIEQINYSYYHNAKQRYRYTLSLVPSNKVAIMSKIIVTNTVVNLGRAHTGINISGRKQGDSITACPRLFSIWHLTVVLGQCMTEAISSVACMHTDRYFDCWIDSSMFPSR
jgi:hypothetical protein